MASEKHSKKARNSKVMRNTSTVDSNRKVESGEGCEAGRLGGETPPPLLSFDDFLQKCLAIKGIERVWFLACADVAGGDFQLLVDADNDAAAS